MQADADQPVARHVRVVSISVKGHAFVTQIGGRCKEVRRVCITTPMVTVFVTISVTRNKESRVERSVADQQFVVIIAIHGSHTFPSSVCTGSLPIISCGRYRLDAFSFKVGLVSSFVINENDFCKLIRWKEIKLVKV